MDDNNNSSDGVEPASIQTMTAWARLKANFAWVAASIAIVSFAAGWTAHYALVTQGEREIVSRAELLDCRNRSLQLCEEVAPSAQITRPINSAVVSQFVDVEGTVDNLPAGSVIWVALYSHNLQRFFPHHVPAERHGSIRWKVSKLRVGTTEDDGRSFDIVVFASDQNGQMAMDSYLSSPESEGLARLPIASIELLRIKVRRLPK